jgi:hypothetical protein
MITNYFWGFHLSIIEKKNQYKFFFQLDFISSCFSWTLFVRYVNKHKQINLKKSVNDLIIFMMIFLYSDMTNELWCFFCAPTLMTCIIFCCFTNLKSTKKLFQLEIIGQALVSTVGGVMRVTVLHFKSTSCFICILYFTPSPCLYLWVTKFGELSSKIERK